MDKKNWVRSWIGTGGDDILALYDQLKVELCNENHISFTNFPLPLVMFDELLVRVGLRIPSSTHSTGIYLNCYTLSIRWHKLSISNQNVQYKFLIRYIYVQLVMNTLCIRSKLKNNIDSSAYDSVLEKFSYVGIRWLNSQGVTAP